MIIQGVLDQMAQVIVGENEGIESALRRFKRQVSRADIFSDIKKKRYFETPIEKAKRKAISRRRKRRFKANANASS
ncbi:30s ribosomal protein s21 [Leptolyngbya sp. Heron Island J]|nr:30s ribosomal protein s21 [Leptolyngbya sp. Heron Island J]